MAQDESQHDTDARDESEDEARGADLEKRDKPQESLATDQANMHPGQADDPDSDPDDDPDDREQREALLDSVREGR